MFAHIAILLAALAASPYQHFVLKPGTSVWDVAARDVTGDDNAELFVLCCDEKSDPLEKFVAVYIASDAGEYDEAPSLRIDLEPAVSALFFVATDGAPPVELAAADAEGACIYRFSDGAFERIASPRFASLLPYGAKEPVFLKGRAMDLDADGIDEWLIPVPDGCEIRTPGTLLRKVPCHTVGAIYPGDTVYISHRLPACRAFDVEGEPAKCLAFLSDEFADFVHGPGWSRHVRFKIPLDVEEKWEASTKMDDVNGDGLPDLAVTQTKGTINLRAVTHVYLASAPFTYPTEPTATFETQGAIASPSLFDVNGDEKRDLVFICIPFGVRNVVNFLVRRKLTARIEVYHFDGAGFPAKPTFTRSLTFDAPDGRERVVYTLGDFNGDTFADVAFGAGANKLAIHTGSTDSLLSPRPWVRLDLPTFGNARPCDLNGNASKDLVISHPGGKNRKRVEVIVF